MLLHGVLMCCERIQCFSLPFPSTPHHRATTTSSATPTARCSKWICSVFLLYITCLPDSLQAFRQPFFGSRHRACSISKTRDCTCVIIIAMKISQIYAAKQFRTSSSSVAKKEPKSKRRRKPAKSVKQQKPRPREMSGLSYSQPVPRFIAALPQISNPPGRAKEEL